MNATYPVQMEREIPTRNQHNLSAAVCLVARSGIIVALYLAAFLGALQLAAVLPEPWSAVGITALLLVAGLALRGKWSGRKFRLESVGLGYQPDGQAGAPGAEFAPGAFDFSQPKLDRTPCLPAALKGYPPPSKPLKVILD
jgi:hypothetical protein